MLFSLFSFIILIGMVILVHEWGHFTVARKLKMRVDEFGFGFSGEEFGFKYPKKLFKFHKNKVLYSINPMPLGGFVKIFGEGGEDAENPESFSSRPFWQRFSVLFAGVAMNLVLAWVLFSLVAAIGAPTAIADEEIPGVGEVSVMINAVSPGSPADKAKIRMGDIITRLENKASGRTIEVKKTDDIKNFAKENLGQELVVTVKRGRNVFDVTVLPRQDPPAGEGPIGISIMLVGMLRTPWYQAPWVGAQNVYQNFTAIATAFYGLARDLFVRGTPGMDVVGPVGIAAVSGQFAGLGIMYFLNFVAAVSVNLAFINVLPIPALDGGRILFLLIEKIRGSKMNPVIEYKLHGAFFYLLLLLILALTYRDVLRFL